MTKKKILSLCMVAALTATAFVGGTLAYFTDTDTATNEFTVGGVEIELVEKDENGDDWSKKELMPGENNAVVKNVTVKNTGANDAYLWAEIWIPTALDAGKDNASDNNLHWNNFNTYKDKEGKLVLCRVKEAEANGYTLVAETMSDYLGEVDGYYGYRLWIKGDSAKKKDESTYSLLYRVFMDQRVEQCTDDACTCSGSGLKLVNGDCYTGDWEIIVNAFGIQAEGFDSIDEAIQAYDGEGAGKPNQN